MKVVKNNCQWTLHRTAIPVEDSIANEEQLNKELALHKEVVQGMRYQPWDMGRKLRVLRRAKVYVAQHEGALQQRLAESRTAKDIFEQTQLLITKVCQWKLIRHNITAFYMTCD